MFSECRSTWMVDTIYEITPAQLKKLGTEAVLAGLGNALIIWNNPDGTGELKTWLLKMKNARVTVLTISNNKDSRIRRIVEKSGLDCVAHALKPTARDFKLTEKN